MESSKIHAEKLVGNETIKILSGKKCGEILRHTIFDSKIRRSERLTLERNVEIVTSSEKKKIVRIHDIRFQGKRSIDWRQVREYLRDYVGAAYEIADTKDIIYIGFDLPDEYTRYNRFRATMLIRHSADGKSIYMISWT